VPEEIDDQTNDGSNDNREDAIAKYTNALEE
jgi:hypothetical protein